jgi:predicted regulator of Ras-like GTPase activity (Roadblock/LC7/MglB family)
MDASAALTELVGLSTQVVEAVIAGPDGAVEAAHTASDARARALAATAVKLLSEVGDLHAPVPVERVQVDLERGSVFVVRDLERTIVAATVAEPVGGLVAHDLRTALRRVRGAAT